MVDRKKYNVVFMGTPDFAKESLKALVESSYNVTLVLTNKDKPSGRGMKLKASEVKEYALEKGIKVYQPDSLKKNEEAYNLIKSENPDFICVTAYGKLLPEEILNIPKYGCINVHGSLLPKYRGSAPIQRSIINGERFAGVTTMFMDKGMDTGDMLLKEETPITDEDTLESLYDRLKVIGANLLIKTLDEIIEKTIKREKQGENFTLAPMINKEDCKINFKKLSAREVFNLVRGLYPFPGAYIVVENGGAIFKIGSVSINSKIENSNESNNQSKIGNDIAGKIINMDKKTLTIACKENTSVNILKIQPQGKNMMNIADFLNGKKLTGDEKFE